MQDFSEKSIFPLGCPAIVTVLCDFLVNGFVNLLLPPPRPLITKCPHAGVCSSGSTRSIVNGGKPRVKLKKIPPEVGQERQCSKCVLLPELAVLSSAIELYRCWSEFFSVDIQSVENGENRCTLERNDAVRTPEVHQPKEQTRNAAAKGLKKASTTHQQKMAAQSDSNNLGDLQLAPLFFIKILKEMYSTDLITR